MRGPEAPATPQQVNAFVLGVRLAELDVALRTGDTETASVLTYRIESLLDADDATTLVAYYAGPGSIRDGLDAPHPRRLAPRPQRRGRRAAGTGTRSATTRAS